ncbi:MAG: sugar ABC transporter ATP-binding protein [Spirochaetales bacterium]|uniref:Autoinducer 2 import ATP-binding protein LsrA n=1 Tax=Candidatus Thalassospirochaeta sargassi TaxID=3119039 RepID=A0AAJ1MNC7_9SPIO|nr:sugar ABC transporter ATP-binding protein [Spirochaetales bacterium]
MSDYALEVRGIVKDFPGTRALDRVDLTLKKGEILALVGENGAGKSTLMNVIDGVHLPDEGQIFIDGNEVNIRNPLDAQKYGIGFVHQEIALCQHVSVAENVFMSELNSTDRKFINYRDLYRRAKKALAPLGDIDPRKKVSELSISNQQIVEIAKALSLNCKILILDEPTAALTESETDALFNIMEELKKKGISMIYISHRMAEIFSQCDRVSILRDGEYCGSLNVDETNSREVVTRMVGREISNLYPAKFDGNCIEQDELLRVEDFSDSKRFTDISFTLHEGEILGLSGLIGAGRSEIVKAVCGLFPKKKGDVYFRGEKLDIHHYEDAINNGIVYLSEDRKVEGVFLDMSIQRNISVLDLKAVSVNGIVNINKEKGLAEEYSKKLNVKCSTLSQNVSSLSGGNQQKVLISKLLSIKPKVVIMDEPTRGIDVGAKSEIHKLLRNLTHEGIGVIMISSELPELIGMSDRVLVMHEGESCGIISGDDINEKKIIHMASGLEKVGA